MPTTRHLDRIEASPHAILFEDPRAVKLSLDAGETVPEHDHPGKTVICYLLSGRLEFSLGDTVRELEAGDVMRFDGDQAISPRALADATALLLFVPDDA